MLGMKYLIPFLLAACSNSNWQTASRDSAKLAPLPSEHQEAIVQIYTARTFGWRGSFAVHPWVTWKKKGESDYTVAHIMGWRLRTQNSALVVSHDIPDRHWFGNKPNLIYEATGEKANKIIARFQELIEQYPYKDVYRAYPGPNSNTFVAYLIHNTDEIKISLPPHAIGKDWPIQSQILTSSPSKTGVQFNTYGVFGMTVGLEEGIEINLMALNFGIDFYPPAIKLPLIGRLGFPDKGLTE